MKLTDDKVVFPAMAAMFFIGVATTLAGICWLIYQLVTGDPMIAICVFASVCVICATVVYLVQAENSGRNRVSEAEAAKKVERIMRADRVVEHK